MKFARRKKLTYNFGMGFVSVVCRKWGFHSKLGEEREFAGSIIVSSGASFSFPSCLVARRQPNQTRIFHTTTSESANDDRQSSNVANKLSSCQSLAENHNSLSSK